jgi:glycosyltransferase involved in cell wall biosynthesis
MPLDILFVHNNFPGQFGFVVNALRARGDRVAAIGQETAPGMPDVPIARWRASRGTAKDIFGIATRAEADYIRGHAAAGAATQLQARGFEPSVIVGHPGWGETTLLGEIFPKARRIEYAEFFYRTQGGDVGFDPEFPMPDLAERFRVHAKNATMALVYAEADRIVVPTPFQGRMLPASLAPIIRTIHEGIDTDRIRPNPGATFTLPSGRVLDSSMPVVTFVNRRFEPLRGCHIFFRALPALLEAVPEAEVIMVGADEAGGYGAAPPSGQTWKQLFLAEITGRVDLDRLHFTGRLPHDRMLAAVALGRAHVFLTYPFVASWSFFEALATGAMVIGSATGPVIDVIEHGRNGLLVDFFDVAGLSAALIDACRRPEAYQPHREAARQTILDRFDQKTRTIPAWLSLIDEVAAMGPRPIAR